jgi:hypothetical protein
MKVLSRYSLRDIVEENHENLLTGGVNMEIITWYFPNASRGASLLLLMLLPA